MKRHPRANVRLCVASQVVLLTSLLVVPNTLSTPPDAWPPARLRDTGLYSDWATKTVAPGNLPYAPLYPLWSDGAAKRRWLRLPKGAAIDASDPDRWRFPVGTRLWKEFRFSRRIETRFIERTSAGWRYATYLWSEDESEALPAPQRGVAQSVEIRDGVRHAIPSLADCRACHEASAVPVLGLSALQLSPDRDPEAPHAEPVPDGGVDLRSLVERRLVRGLPRRLSEEAPRIEAPTATSRAALGYLLANCGTCHNESGPLASLGLALEYAIGRPAGQEPPALRTAVGRASRFRLPAGASDVSERLRPGDPERSVLLARMSSRDPVLQMPPLGTRIVDEQAVGLIRRWIAEDLRTSGARSPERHPPATEDERRER